MQLLAYGSDDGAPEPLIVDRNLDGVVRKAPGFLHIPVNDKCSH